MILITVEDPLGEAISKAQLTAHPLESKTPVSTLVYDESCQLYVSASVPFGRYVLSVEADGYVKQEVTLQVTGSEYNDRVVLGRPGSFFYVQGSRRIYFELDDEKIAAQVQEGEAERSRGRVGLSPGQEVVSSDALTRLRDLESNLRSPAGLLIFDRAQLRAKVGDRTLERDLRDAPEVLDAGPLLRSKEASWVFLSRFIEVIVGSGIGQKELAKQIDRFGLRIFYQDRHEPNLFILESTGVPKPEFGALPERLLMLDCVQWAASVLSAPCETTAAVLPNDVDFALQFQNYITRHPEAWEQLNPVGAADSFGNADVIVAVHDDGIQTTGRGSAISHPEFSGMVAGGSLSLQPGLNSRKVLFSFDFRPTTGVLIRPGNDTPGSSHGSWTAGVISAANDGTAGTVGGAANTRLCSYIFFATTSSPRFNHAFDFMAGFDPGWLPGVGGYGAAQVFPASFSTGRNPGPGAHVINCSHTYPIAPTGAFRRVLQRITLFGRDRHGVLVFAAAGNQDRDCRVDGGWAEDTNVMRVAASSVDLRLEEVRMNYSSHALVGDRVVDFAAPSESQNVAPTIHQAPRMFGFVSVDQNTGSGNLAASAVARAPLVNSPLAGSAVIKVAAASLGSFFANDKVIIRSLDNSFFSESHEVASTTPSKTIKLKRRLGYSYSKGRAEIVRLGAAVGYTNGFGGTSAATPQASAIAALMLSANPALSWLEVRELMRSTAVPVNLRYRGSIYSGGPNFRYRWLDTSAGPLPMDLVDADGLLTITGGNRAVSAGPVHQGDRLLTLDNVAGILPRQALLIGAETKLNGVHPLPAPNQRIINVERNDEFEIGDTLCIGKNSQTVVILAAAVGDTFVWVQSVDGFVPNDDITINPGGTSVETVRILSVRRMPFNNGWNFGAADTGFNITRLDANGAPIGGGLTNAHGRAETIAIANTQFEGLFKVKDKGAGSLTLNKSVVGNHPGGRIVVKHGTEVKAVIRVWPASNQVEVDPLDFEHPFNANGVEHVRIGRIAGYSLAFGYGRLDALEAVKAAQSYAHDARDLKVRNFLADDGVNNTGAQEVESPDVWVRNDAATTAAMLPGYEDPGPHQHPEVTVDPAVFIGGGIHDLEVSGSCTSAAEVTFTIEVDAIGTPDTFGWSKDGGATTAGVSMTGSAQVLDDGVRVRFAAPTGHKLGDRWLVKARQIANRYLHIRSYNRGNQSFFTASTMGGGVSLEVARSRLLLCSSDGFPVCRFSSVAVVPGNNDLEVISAFSGPAARALFTVEITAMAATGDTFCWHREGTVQSTVVLAAGAQVHALNDGVQIRFGSHKDHKVGDRWDIYARSGTKAFLNLDHYWEYDEPTPFDLASSGQAGTRVMAENAINGLAAAAFQIDSVAWPEGLRPATNSPNQPKSTRPLRLFALGEVVPHDGILTGFTAETNNNFSFRELVFAKFRLTGEDGETGLDSHLDVDHKGTDVTRAFRVEVRTTAGTFATERVRVKLTAHKQGGVEEVHVYLFDTVAGNWRFDPSDPSWATLAPPLEVRRTDGTLHAAIGEQFDIHFGGTYSVNKGFSQLEIEVQILSSFRDLAIASASHTVKVYELVPLPTGTDLAESVTLPAPSSYAFADMASLTQNAQQAFGPVDGQETTRYRTTSLFHCATEVKAYAVTFGFVMLQRDPANINAVNLILRPFVQPAARFKPVRYFIYRGLRLTDFLAGHSATDEKKIRDRTGASDFIEETWATFLDQNQGATEMPSTVLGYDPGNQKGDDTLDSVFFRVGSGMQLPPAKKGLYLGRFYHQNNYDFGFEIVLEEGAYLPDLSYARLATHEVVRSGGTTEDLAYKIKHDEILNFIDPAAFYGLHLHDGGELEVVGHVGALSREDIFEKVVNRFHTKHTLYVDIRSENGSSLNFYRNYGDSTGNQVAIGDEIGSLARQAYATHGWPILIVDRSADFNTQEEYNEVYLRLRVDDNEKPVLYVDHGNLLTLATHGKFVRGTHLRIGTDPWTWRLGFSFPNTGPAAAKKGIAWVLRLIYGRLEGSTMPPTVLQTTKYTDNVFGPVDRTSRWAGGDGLRWFTTQDNRYVDADSSLGWKQMMECGMAQQTGSVSRVLLYAVVKDNDTNAVVNPDKPEDFVPIRGITDGVSKRESFFAERGLFGVYLLEHDQIEDSSLAVRTLELRQRPVNGYPPTNALLLGLERAQFDTLKALSSQGISSEYFRNILLADKVSQVSVSGKSYDKYRLGIQGLKTNNGEFGTEFPASDIHAYSTDGHFFYTRAFSEAEPLPTVYARNYEEEKGIRERPARERRIALVDTVANTVTIANSDWTREIVVGDEIKIAKSAKNDGKYPVAAIALTGVDTVITVGGGGVGSDEEPLGCVFTSPKPIEDFFIDLDRDLAISGIARMRDLVDSFGRDIVAIANDAAALAALRDKVEEFAPKILRRAQLLTQNDRTRADDYERMLYWARLRMQVELKSHPFCLASLSGRRELVDLIFERNSRGYGVRLTDAPGGAKKILLTGFDPFSLASDLETTNPSASVALALHGQVISSSGRTAYVESAIFPVRYRDFDASWVEVLTLPLLAGSNKVDMIISVSQNGSNTFYDLERFAGRRRGILADNEFVRKPEQWLGEDATHDEFYEATLPVSAMVPGPFGALSGQQVFYDQSYVAVDPVSFERHPKKLGYNDNMPKPGLTLSSIKGRAFRGSGGDYLSNEIFYRISRLRDEVVGSSALTGHFHIPAVKYAGVGIEKIIDEVEELIKKWLASL